MEKRLENLHLETKLIDAKECFPLGRGAKAAFSAMKDAEKKELIENAEKILPQVIPALSATAYMRFMKEGDGNRTVFERVYFDRRIHLMQLVAAECAEGQGRFLDKIVDFMWAIMEETTWVLPAHNLPMDRGSVHANLPDCFGQKPWYFDLFAAETADLFSVVWHLLGPELTERCGNIFTERVEYELRTRIINPYLAAGDQDLHWLGHRPGIKPNNWTPWITASILSVCAVFVKEPEERRDFVHKAVRSLDSFVDGYFPDGGCPEGPTYWGAAPASLFDAMETLDAMTGGRIQIFEDAKTKAMMEFEPDVYIHGDYITGYGDAQPSMKPDIRLFARMGARFKSEKLSAFAAARQPEPVLPSQHHPIRLFRNLLYTIPCTNTPFTVAKTTVYEGIGLVILRESEKTDRGFAAWMKGGSNNESHGHKDIGNVAVYYNGQPVLIDAGIGEYTRALFHGKRDLIFGSATRDHNLALIGGMGQGVRKSFDEEEYVSRNLEVKGTALRLDLDRAYINRDSIKQYLREVELTPGCFSLRDHIVLAEEMDILFAFHSIIPMEIKDEKIHFENGLIAEFDRGFAAVVEAHEFPDTTYKEKWQRDFYYKLTFSARSKAVDLCLQFRKDK